MLQSLLDELDQGMSSEHGDTQSQLVSLIFDLTLTWIT